MTTPHKALLIQARDALLLACRRSDRVIDKEYEEAIAALQAAIDAPEPEPVAHIRQTYIVGLDGELLGVSEKKELRFGCGNDYAHCTPLYTNPPAREPLSDAEIDAAWRSVDYQVSYDQFRRDVGRAIEAAHGIKS